MARMFGASYPEVGHCKRLPCAAALDTWIAREGRRGVVSSKRSTAVDTTCRNNMGFNVPSNRFASGLM